ncbi:MAG: hypothetical protein PHF86_02480 [Candidatus Nanoarchaeia archaeon]|nr:hypothetical protein [Candidatus Nanoarchaeia archaeon]
MNKKSTHKRGPNKSDSLRNKMFAMYIDINRDYLNTTNGINIDVNKLKDPDKATSKFFEDQYGNQGCRKANTHWRMLRNLLGNVPFSKKSDQKNHHSKYDYTLICKVKSDLTKFGKIISF